ncbi:hypothetical protein ABTA67_19740, partial [Acinetobacter baumannii]
AIDPEWDESGKYLYFLSSTDYGLASGWLDMSSYNYPVNRNLYVAVLSKDAPSPLEPRSDEEPVKSTDTSKPAAKPVVASNKVKIDIEGLEQRIL